MSRFEFVRPRCRMLRRYSPGARLFRNVGRSDSGCIRGEVRPAQNAAERSRKRQVGSNGGNGPGSRRGGGDAGEALDETPSLIRSRSRQDSESGCVVRGVCSGADSGLSGRSVEPLIISERRRQTARLHPRPARRLRSSSLLSGRSVETLYKHDSNFRKFDSSECVIRLSEQRLTASARGTARALRHCVVNGDVP